MEKTEIAYLADRPHLIPVCASWAYGQWGCQSDGSLNRAIDKFSEGANKKQLPITFVATINQKPAGMVSLWAADYDERPDLSPWLASLYVHPFYRRKYVAALLIERAEQEVRRFRYPRCFLVTEEAEGLYAKYGWEKGEPVRTCYGSAALMKKDFP